MPKYVAFLRAINLGGHTLKMEPLRRLFEEMGFSGVETFIASGNVLFEADSTNTWELERKVEASLHDRLGFSVATFIRTADELAEIACYDPFKAPDLDSEGSTLYIVFAAGPPGDQEVQKLLELASDANQLHASGREIYWLCRTSFSDSGFSLALLEKALGLPATIRNASTVKRIAKKYTL